MCDTLRRTRACVLAAGALALSSVTAAGGDGPPSEAQVVQLAQSTLALLGYYDGPLDGSFDAATRDALERVVLDGHFAGTYDTLSQPVMIYLKTFVGPALAERFGTDPDGIWDIDLSGLSPEEGQALLDLHQWETLELCASPLAIHFVGMSYGPWLQGSFFVLALDDGALAPLAVPGEPGEPPPAFTLVDADTMHRLVEGETEVWSRCDPGPAPAE